MLGDEAEEGLVIDRVKEHVFFFAKSIIFFLFFQFLFGEFNEEPCHSQILQLID